MKLKHVAIGVFVVFVIGQCSADPGTEHIDRESPRAEVQQPAPSPSASSSAGQGTAFAALALLPVKGRAPLTGYDRDRFGPAWLDADRNGCDTRNDLLGQHLHAITLEDNGCVVAAGSYDDPYTGSQIDYRQGHGALIDIDHVVPMANAWVTGAFGWQIKKRAAFANDPLNLLPADAGANRQKGDGDAATWLPPNKAFRCRYVSRQVAVKDKYDLWVTAPEKAAIARVLTACPGPGADPGHLARRHRGGPQHLRPCGLGGPGGPARPPAPAPSGARPVRPLPELRRRAGRRRRTRTPRRPRLRQPPGPGRRRCRLRVAGCGSACGVS